MEWHVFPAATPFHPPQLYPISPACEPWIRGPFLSQAHNRVKSPDHHVLLQPGLFADTLPSVPSPILASQNWFPWHSLPFFLFPHFLQGLLSSDPSLTSSCPSGMNLSLSKYTSCSAYPARFGPTRGTTILFLQCA